MNDEEKAGGLERRIAGRQERNPDPEALLGRMRCGADGLLEQIRMSRETIEHSKHLLRQIDSLLARSILKR
jgi:hypothetical protein